MIEYLSKITVNGRAIEIPVTAERIEAGEDVVLFNQDMPPSFEADWMQTGYTVQDFLTPEENESIKQAAQTGIKNSMDELNIPSEGFTLEKYHEFVNDETHMQVVDQIRAGGDGTGGIPYNRLPVSLERIEERISQICNCKVVGRKTFNCGEGKTITSSCFWVRIVRPQKFKDNNPPHRDNHLDRGGDEGKKAVNLYYPLAGSNENSALPIIPGSHLWSEKDTVRTFGQVFVNGVKFTNPAIVDSVHGLNLITPNPKFNQVMVFTPYVIHGGGFNFNSDVTRVSLEMRFWRP
jgi:hypothetical protein